MHKTFYVRIIAYFRKFLKHSFSKNIIIIYFMYELLFNKYLYEFFPNYYLRHNFEIIILFMKKLPKYLFMFLSKLKLSRKLNPCFKKN